MSSSSCSWPTLIPIARYHFCLDFSRLLIYLYLLLFSCSVFVILSKAYLLLFELLFRVLVLREQQQVFKCETSFRFSCDSLPRLRVTWVCNECLCEFVVEVVRNLLLHCPQEWLIALTNYSVSPPPLVVHQHLLNPISCEAVVETSNVLHWRCSRQGVKGSQRQVRKRQQEVQQLQ